MSHTSVEERAGKMFLAEQQLTISSGICDWFAGERLVDCKMDYIGVCVRVVLFRSLLESNALNSSFAPGALGDPLFYDVMQPYSDHDPYLTIGVPFESLLATPTICQRVVLQRRAAASDHTQDDQNTLHKARVRNSSTLNLPLDLMSNLPFSGSLLPL
jgi:hypothetical protein